MIVTVDEIKDHLRIQHTDEDAYLASLITQAEAAALEYCALEEVPDPAPETMRLAVILMVSHYYEYRDSADKHALISMQMSFRSLLYPHKNITF